MRLPTDKWHPRQARAELDSWLQIRLTEWVGDRKRFAFDEVVDPIPRTRVRPHRARSLSLTGGRAVPAWCLALRKCQRNRHQIRARTKNPLVRVRSYEFEAAPDTFFSTKSSSGRCAQVRAEPLSRRYGRHPDSLHLPRERHCLL